MRGECRHRSQYLLYTWGRWWLLQQRRDRSREWLGILCSFKLFLNLKQYVQYQYNNNTQNILIPFLGETYSIDTRSKSNKEINSLNLLSSQECFEVFVRQCHANTCKKEENGHPNDRNSEWHKGKKNSAGCNCETLTDVECLNSCFFPATGNDQAHGKNCAVRESSQH